MDLLDAELHAVPMMTARLPYLRDGKDLSKREAKTICTLFAGAGGWEQIIEGRRKSGAIERSLSVNARH